MRTGIVAGLVVGAILAAQGGHGAGAAVFGSFGDPAHAENAKQRVETELGIPARVVAVDVAGKRYRRVIAADFETSSAAHATIAQARAAGFEGAWYWPQAHPAGSSAHRAAPPPMPPPVSPTVRTTAPTPPAPLPDSQRVDAPPADVGDRLKLVAAADAGQSIAVPRYDDVDIHIDGRLDEPVWAEVAGYNNMVVVEPDTLGKARFRTISRFLYTDRGLYIGVWNEQPPETLITRLSGRDDYINRDGWGITLDTSGEGLYGYWFSINLGGSVLDGKVAPEREFTSEWDGPWDSATAALDDGWSLEAFLPWSMMTMPQVEGERTMGMFTNRKVAYIDERWGWPALPFTAARFMSALQPMRLPGVKPQQQLAVFPYTSTTVDNTRNEEGYRAGLDVFWRPSSNFQVTATANPDFGAVESDDVVVNLTARETYFPEKRLFFLEGSEIFTTSVRSRMYSGSGGSGGRRTVSTYSRTPAAVLNTRRIGGAPIGIEVPDGVSVPGPERSRPSDLLGAAKVTGQNGPLRYGVLAAFEDDPVLRGESADGTPVEVPGIGRNFGVARLLYERTGQSRQAVGYIGTLLDHPSVDAVVHGVDVHQMSRNGKWSTDLQGLKSDVDGESGYGLWADVSYTQRQGLTHSLALDYHDRTLDINDLGFLDRNDKVGGRYSARISRSNVGWFRRFSSMLSVGHYVNADGLAVSSGLSTYTSLTFHNRNQMRVMATYFSPQWDDLESRGNGVFKVRGRTFVDVSYGTDTSRPFSWSIQTGWMEEDVKSAAHSIAAGFTYKPMDRFSLDFDLTRRFQDAWLLWQGGSDFATFKAAHWQPRLATDMFLSARQQLRLTLQWAGIRASEQEYWRIPEQAGRLVQVVADPSADRDGFTISQLAAQLRYRWEIAPLSDLFVVYTRGSNLDNRIHDAVDSLFLDALREPLVDALVVKLRYRFGA